MIHQPISMASQCGAGAWLNGLASGDQHQLTGSGNASEACLQQCTIHIYRYFTVSKKHAAAYSLFSYNWNWKQRLLLCLQLTCGV